MEYCFFWSTIYEWTHQDYWSNWLQQSLMLCSKTHVTIGLHCCWWRKLRCHCHVKPVTAQRLAAELRFYSVIKDLCLDSTNIAEFTLQSVKKTSNCREKATKYSAGPTQSFAMAKWCRWKARGRFSRTRTHVKDKNSPVTIRILLGFCSHGILLSRNLLSCKDTNSAGTEEKALSKVNCRYGRSLCRRILQYLIM